MQRAEANDGGNARSGPGRPRNSAVDRAIQRAALGLFIESGLESVGIEQIAKRAGVARTTIYRRWTSKESIIADAIAKERGGAEQKAMTRRIPPRVMVEKVIDALAGTITAGDYSTMLARLIGSVPDHPELMSTYWRVHLAPRRQKVRLMLEQARDHGLIRKDFDQELALDLIAGAIMHRVLVHPGKSSDRNVRSYLRKLIRELGIDPKHTGGIDYGEVR
jgi:AcrR family transcriptional regulator